MGGKEGFTDPLSSAELSHFLKVSDRRRNTPKSAHYRSESLCAGLPCRIFGVWFGQVLGPNPVRNRRFLAGSLKVFGALVAQPSKGPLIVFFRTRETSARSGWADVDGRRLGRVRH